jgi:dienelactone hydrolase
MAEVVLFHSVLGVRLGVVDAADRMRAMGHTVHAPNLYEDGLVFDHYEKAMAYVDAMGYRELLARTDAAVRSIPANVVYAGFSNGGVSAEYLVATRPGATGCLLFAAAMPLGGFAGIADVGPWPSSADVHVHYTKDDPFREQDALDAFANEVRATGARFTLYEYSGTGHLFTDRTLPAEYDEAASELVWERVAAFLAER